MHLRSDRRPADDADRTADPGLIGVQDEHPVFWIGAVFGGVVQVLAGMLSYFKGDDFHFLVYNAFGWYWIVVPGFLLGEELGVLYVAPDARGTFALCFAVLALAFTPPAAQHNSVLPVTLLCVSAGLALQGFAAFAEAPALATTGSILLLAASALAAYMGIEKFYWRTLGRHLLPLGPAWIRPAGPIDPES